MSKETGEQTSEHINLYKDKYSDTSSPSVTEEVLRRFFPGGEIIGQPQKTGVVVIQDSPNGKHIAAAIRHPRLIVHGDGFGGKQTEGMIERSLLTRVGREGAKRTAERLLEDQAIPTSGVELEGIVHDAKTGEVMPALVRVECYDGEREDATKPMDSLEGTAIERAKIILRRAEEEGKEGNVVVESSEPMSFGGKRVDQNRGIKLSEKPYVQVMARLVQGEYFVPFESLDFRVQQVLTQIANNQNFDSIEKMLEKLGLARVWTVASSHASFGIPPKEKPQMELGIAIANIFLSDLATCADMLTHGTPMHGGNLMRIKDHEGKQVIVHDVRALSRYALRSAYSGKFIDNPDMLIERIQNGVVDGLATTPDRAAFPNIGPDGVPFIDAHGKVRYRGSGDPNVPTARVEVVSGSATPSVYDLLARDAYLALLWTAALEAAANGKNPQEYFPEKGFPSVGTCAKQMDLAIKHAMYGANDPDVENLLDENRRFMNYMDDGYPHLRKYIRYCSARFDNLRVEAVADTVDKYTKNPQGNISDVIIRMKEGGCSDVLILNQLSDHQIAAAKTIVECNGDYELLLERIKLGRGTSTSVSFIDSRRYERGSIGGERVIYQV